MPSIVRSGLRTVLFVLAHQDDECVMSTRIVRELESNNTPVCAFLTDGSAKGTSSAVRDAESHRALSMLGVGDDDVLFLGSANGIPDGKLALHLDDAYRLLESAVAGRPIHRIYCLAYEGGHQDHDASHALALALAYRRGVLNQTWQVPYYHGHRTRWRFFHMQARLPDSPHCHSRRLPAMLALRHSLLALKFPSQWRTWVGLFPPFFVRRAIQRRELVQAVDRNALSGPPHPGSLLYERMQGFSYHDFRQAMDHFLATHFS